MTLYSKQSGFAMLEVLLAVVVIAMASVGGYLLFGSATNKTQMSQMTSQLSQIASAYSTLASANLTNSVPSQTVANLLYNSGQLSKNYFSVDGDGNYQLSSPYGDIAISNESPVGFTIKFFFGLDQTATQAQSLYNSVQDSYICPENGGCDGNYDKAEGYMTLVLDLTK